MENVFLPQPRKINIKPVAISPTIWTIKVISMTPIVFSNVLFHAACMTANTPVKPPNPRSKNIPFSTKYHPY
jgi:hypothetical protein